MNVQLFLLLAFLLGSVLVVEAARKIYDPLNVFCGADNCYEVLEIKKSATKRQITSAYRRKAAIYHPDKYKEKNATVVFQKIAKAFEVLENNKSRENFDYYLANPTDYFKASGGLEHYYKALPKAPLSLVIVFALLLLSAFLHVTQLNRHERALRILRDKVGRGLSEREGGNKQTVELFRQAEERYVAFVQQRAQDNIQSREAGTSTALSNMNKKADKKAAKGAVSRPAMIADPEFRRIVEELLASIKIEGGYAKPELKDLFVLRVLLLPVSLYAWAAKYHRRHVSSVPLSLEERTEMAMEVVGLASWDELSAIQRHQAIEAEVWKSAAYEKWQAKREEELKKRDKKRGIERDGEED